MIARLYPFEFERSLLCQSDPGMTTGPADSATAVDNKLAEMLQRLNSLANGKGTPQQRPRAESAPAPSAIPTVTSPTDVATALHRALPVTQTPTQANSAYAAVVEKQLVAPKPAATEYIPPEPTNLSDASISGEDIESISLKFLLARGTATGSEIADQLRLPFVLIEPILRQLKQEQVISYKGTTNSGDFVYVLGDVGRERARRYNDLCKYFGTVPVTLKDYIFSVNAQSLEHQRIGPTNLQRAFGDLQIPDRIMNKLGPAISAGKGMFLFGAPGNGKTSIAERVTKAFGETIWIPRAVGVEGEIVRVFDPAVHEEAPLPNDGGVIKSLHYDRRWVRIKRPTIVVGGELTMEQLEITYNESTGISEAPMQMKSNCGTLVIDDFGRQKMRVDELLNRWIVPLEKRYDFLCTISGKKIQIPFAQLIVFSTNLEPRDLVDDAFLRRIPYKIEVVDPNEQEFRNLFKIMCKKLGFEYSDAALDYLIEKHYRPKNRFFRNCHARDLLLQIKYLCQYNERPLELTPATFDFAVENYFSIV